MTIGIISLAALVALIAFGPIVKKGKSATNNGFRVTMPPREKLEADGQSYAGVLAQEKAEFRIAWIAGGLLASPSLVAFPEGFLLFAALGQTIARLLTNSFDYVGHGVEIMVAEESGFIGYREQEIARMISRDPKRKGMTPEQVDAKLRKWHWLAKIGRKLV